MDTYLTLSEIPTWHRRDIAAVAAAENVLGNLAAGVVVAVNDMDSFS